MIAWKTGELSFEPGFISLMQDKSNQQPISHWSERTGVVGKRIRFLFFVFSWDLAADFGKLKNRWRKENVINMQMDTLWLKYWQENSLVSLIHDVSALDTFCTQVLYNKFTFLMKELFLED